MTSLDIVTIIKSLPCPRKSPGSFVGAVYDLSSPTGDLPTVLVVGINYGQMATSKAVVGKHVDNAGYAKHAAALSQTMGLPSNCHTVLWNFFPHLTSSPWTEDVRNSAEEAERIFDQGYVDPFQVFHALVGHLQPQLIVFHGTTSAVPILARVGLRGISQPAILIDNLSRGFHRASLKRIQ